MNNIKKLSLLFLVVICVTLFLTLLVLVATRNNKLLTIDQNLAITFFNNRTKFLDYLFVIVSYLGETSIIGLFCVILVILPNRKKLGIPLTCATIISLIINFVFKIAIARQRPVGLFLVEPILNYQVPTGFSFPSGHSQIACTFYFVLCYLILNQIKQKWKRIVITISTVILCLLMCLSRVYLCAHFLSDVIAGICIMTTIVFIFIYLYENNPKYRFLICE